MDNREFGFPAEVLLAVGEHLQADGHTAAIVVVGGSALSVMGWIDRVTNDVDVIARAIEKDGGRELVPPEPLPPPLAEAALRVARDYGLREDWLNTVIGAQWTSGLPDDFLEDIQWRRFGALEVGFAGRKSLIALKLFAAVDQGVTSVHCQDLIGLVPSIEELGTAANWVAKQDAGEPFPSLLEEIVRYVRDRLGRDRGSS